MVSNSQFGIQRDISHDRETVGKRVNFQREAEIDRRINLVPVSITQNHGTPYVTNTSYLLNLIRFIDDEKKITRFFSFEQLSNDFLAKYGVRNNA